MHKEYPGLEQIIQQSKVTLLPGRFAMAKVRGVKDWNGMFMLTNDEDEITIVADEHQIANVHYLDVQKWFRLVRLAVSVPFFSVGFLSTVTTGIARKGLNVLVISTFSYDYLLIRDEDIITALNALQEIGFSVCKEDMASSC